MYFGENIDQPCIYSLSGKQNHPIHFLDLPADTIAAVEFSLNTKLFFPHLMPPLQNCSNSDILKYYQKLQMLTNDPQSPL